MRWTVHLAESARADLRDLSERMRRNAFRKITAMEEDPFPRGCKKLSTPAELYRVRSGEYRIVFAVNRQHRTVAVIRVRHRKDVYRGL
jgi:mRNA interferase RelE/StbE